MRHYNLDSNGYLVDSFGGCHNFRDPVLKLDDHIAAIKELTDLLAQVENRNLDLQRMVDERIHRLENERDSFKAIAEKWRALYEKHMREASALRLELDDIKLNRRWTLREFCEYLEDHGYIDSDWCFEEPGPIAGFNLDQKNKQRDPSAEQAKS